MSPPLRRGGGGESLRVPGLALTTRPHSYDALKAQIYKFEKQAVLQQAATGPATSYRDEPSDLEAAAAAGPVDKVKQENEKTFTKLLDKELHKITEFYVAKGAPGRDPQRPRPVRLWWY